jgi:formate--tetrahydrofolate ligase
MRSDIEIANAATPVPITEIALQLGIAENDLELFGSHKAKVPLSIINEKNIGQGNLVLVTAITPTPAGEGKTTISIGLADGLKRLGQQVALALREPSLGPVFGIKGGAAGGGYSQVIPMEEINLHFTGDFSAIEKANNLLAALIDNNIQSKSHNLRIDPRTVLWKRAMDMNDRSLRNTVVALGGKSGGMPRETGFNITAASEIMAIICLAENLSDLKERLGNIYIGDTFEGEPVFAHHLKAQGAMAALLKDAIKPNLVQTLEGTPAFIHGGPFANIAQGTNSIIATKAALAHAKIVVTEAGFGADLGAEKFFNIKCRSGKLNPQAVVLVATIRALKYHGGQELKDLSNPQVEAMRTGIVNLKKHIETIRSFGINPVVAINRFHADTEDEILALKEECTKLDVPVALAEGFEKGGVGMEELAREVISSISQHNEPFKPTYELKDSVRAKIEKVCQVVYGAKHIILSNVAKRQLRKFERLGYSNLPICIAKTQKSLSDDEKLLGRPENFDIHIREFEIAAGAGFIIPIAGNILRMPGLPSLPAAENIDIDDEGNISGLF